MNDSFQWDDVLYRKRNHLPHLDVDGGIYFVTYCLRDAIPDGFLWNLERRRREYLAAIERRFGRTCRADDRQVEKMVRESIFDEMDRGWGRCELAISEIGDLVTESLCYFDGIRYLLESFSVMPNHVHVVFQVLDGRPWWKVTGGWKSYTSKMANRILGREGSFWMDDSYETLIRSERHLERANRYVLENPEKAGLNEWPWVGGRSRDER